MRIIYYYIKVRSEFKFLAYPGLSLPPFERTGPGDLAKKPSLKLVV